MRLFKPSGAHAVAAILIGAACAATSTASAYDPGTDGLLLAAPFPSAVTPMAPYGSSAPLRAREISALIREGVAPARASEAITVQEEISQTDLLRELLSSMVGAYAGVWFDRATPQMHVGVTSPSGRRIAEQAVAHDGLASDVTLTAVRSTWAQLLATQKRWNVRLARLLAREQVETALAPQRNAIAVTLGSSVPARERAVIEQEASRSPVNVLVSAVHQAYLRVIADAETKCNLFAAGKAYCDKPITAGVTIESRNSRAICTAGPLTVPVADKSRTYLLTAGHCIQSGLGNAKWYAFNTAGPPRKEIGQAARQYFNGRRGDVGAINVSRTGQWVEAGATPVFAVSAAWNKMEEKSFPVKGERPPMVGAGNCVQGQTSGGTCGTIKATEVTFGVKEGMVEEEGAAVSAPGDSGGVVIAETKGEYLVEGTDVDHTATNNAIWEPVDTAFTLLTSLNLELLTPTNEVRPLESAKEKEENEKYEKEEKEGSELYEKEEKEREKEEKSLPDVLPGGQLSNPITAATTSGESTLGNGLLSVKSTGSTGIITATSFKSGPFSNTFKEAKDTLGRKCTGLGSAEGTIALEGTFHIRDYKASGTLSTASVLLLKELHFSCGTSLVLVKGCVAGALTPENKLTKTLILTFAKNGEKSDNSIITVLNEENTKEEACQLLLRIGEGASELSVLQQTVTIKEFKQAEDAIEVLVMRL